VRNLRIVRLSIFNKLMKAQDLRNGVFVRVLPEEPSFVPPAHRVTPGSPSEKPTTRQRVPALNSNTVTLWNFCAGFNSVEGKLEWLGESGKC
jgi:hypothetical protein